MSRILVSILVLMSVFSAHAENACMDMFSIATVADGSGVPATDTKPLEDFKKDTLPEPTASIEKIVEQVKETFRMTEAEIEGILVIARKEFGDNTLSRKEILHKLYAEKRKFDAAIDGELQWFGASLSKAVRDMRKRRQQFELAILQGDALIAANMYRALYESYGVSMSLLVNYARGGAGRDAVLAENTSKYLLEGLTSDKQFSDIRKVVVQMFKNGREPEISEILNVLDQVVARTADEFRYVEWRMNKLETDPSTAQSVRDSVEYIRGKLSIDPLTERFRFGLLKDADLRGPHTSGALLESRPQILIYWLKRVSQLQKQHSRMLRLRSIFHIEALQSLLTRLPVSIRGAVLALARIDYNTYVIDRHIESIEAVLLAEKDVRLQVFTGKVGMGDKNKSAQFLETMARLSSDMDTWNEIKVQVKELSGKHANYKELLAQMEAAEALTSKLGFISKLNSPSMHDHVVGWIGPGVLGAGTLIYTNWDTVVQGYVYVLTLMGLQ